MTCGYKIGSTAPARAVTEDGREIREPVLDDGHRRAMTVDLYRAGWSYRLIAQALGVTNDQARAWVTG